MTLIQTLRRIVDVGSALRQTTGHAVPEVSHGVDDGEGVGGLDGAALRTTGQLTQSQQQQAEHVGVGGNVDAWTCATFTILFSFVHRSSGPSLPTTKWDGPSPGEIQGWSRRLFWLLMAVRGRRLTTTNGAERAIFQGFKWDAFSSHHFVPLAGVISGDLP